MTVRIAESPVRLRIAGMSERRKMNCQALGILKKSDMNGLDIQLALQCAPFIGGLKPSNLFITEKNNLRGAVRLFEQSGLSYFVLLKTQLKTVFLLYDEGSLGEYVSNGAAALLLKENGYYNLGLMELLKKCRLRYRQYASEGAGFPHELGIFLGYPIEDVAGFIKNGGKDCLYAGYWKVYADLPAKLSLFKSYENAQLSLLKMLSEGGSMREIIGSGIERRRKEGLYEQKTYSYY